MSDNKQTWIPLLNNFAWIIERSENRLIKNAVFIGYHNEGFLTYYVDNKEVAITEYPDFEVSYEGLNILIDQLLKDDRVPQEAKDYFIENRVDMIEDIKEVIPNDVVKKWIRLPLMLKNLLRNNLLKNPNPSSHKYSPIHGLFFQIFIYFSVIA